MAGVLHITLPQFAAQTEPPLCLDLSLGGPFSKPKAAAHFGNPLIGPSRQQRSNLCFPLESLKHAADDHQFMSIHECNEDAPALVGFSSITSHASMSISRQVSNVEPVLDTGFQPPSSSSLQQDPHKPADSLMKELQARRRQEARKRRTSWIEEKQQKRARREDRGIKGSLSDSLHNNSLLPVASEDGSSLHDFNSLPSKHCFESTVIQRPDCDQERVGACDQAREQQKLPGLDHGMEGVDNPSHASVPCASCGHSQTALCASCIHAQTAPCASCLHSQTAPCPSISIPPSASGHSTSTSELENGDTIDEQSSVQNESSCSRCDSGGGFVGPMHPSVMMPKNSMGCPHPLSVLPILYPYAMPLQWGSFLPWFTQYPHTVGEVSSAFPSPPPQLHDAFSLPVSPPEAPYLFPIADRKPFPWFPFVAAAGGAAQPSAASSPPHTECKVQHPQGFGQEEETEKASICELLLPLLPVVKQANDPTLPPVQEAKALIVHVAGSDTVVSRTVSNVSAMVKANSTKDDGASQRLHIANQVDHQEATSSAPQVNSAARGLSSLHSERRKDSPALASQKLLAGSQQSLPLACETVSNEVKVVRSKSLKGEVLEPNSIGELRHDRPRKGELGNERLPYPKSGEVFHSELHHSSYREDMSEHDQDEGSANSEIASESLGREAAAPIQGQSLADLPWVSTKGTGPNGKTIHGVMYITKGKQARLICRCHGKHMSPFEFVQHSGSSDLSNPERSIVINCFPSGNQHVPTPV